MTALWMVGARSPVVVDDGGVRDTMQPVENPETPAELHNTPDIAHANSDRDPQLTGLTDRHVGGDEYPSEKYAPWWADIARLNYTAPINDQVSSSGTAARREASGQYGSGTMQYQVSLTPELREGAVLGGDYFESEPKQVQQGSGLVMSPIAEDVDWRAVAQNVGTTNARQAYDNTLYNQFWSGLNNAS